jgi:undecaprenyl diphosphate synthase
MKSTLHANEPLHVAIIMDGNGRWATRRGLPRSAGHQAGADAVRRVVEAAPDLGITSLTLFAFSSDNWQRPREEVSALMGLLRHYLRAEIRALVDSGARLTVIGRRDRLPPGLGEEIEAAEHASAAEIGNSRAKIVGAEIGPQAVNETELGVGAFPEQEV